MKNKGQSTIEFLFTFIFSFGFLFLFISLGLNFTAGYVVHFATYMASRTFMTAETNNTNPGLSDTIAEQRGRETFNRYQLSSLGLESLGNISFNFPNRGTRYEYVGAYVNFNTPLSFVNVIGGRQLLNLRSESFLGREPTRADCFERICRAMNGCSQKNGHITAEDNGC